MNFKYFCPCCGYKTIADTHEICSICKWQDDPVQNDKLDGGPGPNLITLRQARYNFDKFGVSDKRFLDRAEKPKEDDKKNPDWKRLPDYEKVYSLKENEEMILIADRCEDPSKIKDWRNLERKKKGKWCSAEYVEVMNQIPEGSRNFINLREVEAIDDETGKPIAGRVMIIGTRIAYNLRPALREYVAALKKSKKTPS